MTVDPDVKDTRGELSETLRPLIGLCDYSGNVLLQRKVTDSETLRPLIGLCDHENLSRFGLGFRLRNTPPANRAL